MSFIPRLKSHRVFSLYTKRKPVLAIQRTQKEPQNWYINVLTLLAIQSKVSHEHLQHNFEALIFSYPNDLKPTLLRPCVQFLGHILVTRTAEQCEHVLLVGFNTWLVEWVDPVQVAGD